MLLGIHTEKFTSNAELTGARDSQGGGLLTLFYLGGKFGPTLRFFQIIFLNFILP